MAIGIRFLEEDGPNRAAVPRMRFSLYRGFNLVVRSGLTTPGARYALLHKVLQEETKSPRDKGFPGAAVTEAGLVAFSAHRIARLHGHPNPQSVARNSAGLLDLANLPDQYKQPILSSCTQQFPGLVDEELPERADLTFDPRWLVMRHFPGRAEFGPEIADQVSQHSALSSIPRCPAHGKIMLDFYQQFVDTIFAPPSAASPDPIAFPHS